MLTTAVFAGMACCARSPLTAKGLWSAKCLLLMPASEAHFKMAATVGSEKSSESQAPDEILPARAIVIGG